MTDRGDDSGDSDRGTDFDATIVSSTREIHTSSSRVATLVVVQGTEIGRHYPLRRKKVTIGRGDEAHVVLRNKEISRAHASIQTLRVGDETLYRLTDLGSTNHVFVNGTRTDTHMLVAGDKIHLGDFVLSFELQDAIDEKFHTEVRNRISYDDLTGLLTLESFSSALEWELGGYASAAVGCAVVMMDIDDFKKLNDTYGHLAGSFVLAEVGRLIRGNLRSFDVASRYGGEEFVSYLPETSAAEALTAANRLRTILGEHQFLHQERVIGLTISMGVSHFPEDGAELEGLIQKADERLYRAKRDGKNRVYSTD